MAATPDHYSELLTAQISHSSSFSTATISSTATTSSANTLITISDQPLSLEGLVTLLADQKGPFLDEVEAKVFAHVSKTGRRESYLLLRKTAMVTAEIERIIQVSIAMFKSLAAL